MTGRYDRPARAPPASKVIDAFGTFAAQTHCCSALSHAEFPTTVGIMTTHIPPDPDVMKMLDDSREPLCILCKASFRDGGGLLCKACAWSDDPPAAPTVEQQPAA